MSYEIERIRESIEKIEEKMSTCEKNIGNLSNSAAQLERVSGAVSKFIESLLKTLDEADSQFILQQLSSGIFEIRSFLSKQPGQILENLSSQRVCLSILSEMKQDQEEIIFSCEEREKRISEISENIKVEDVERRVERRKVGERPEKIKDIRDAIDNTKDDNDADENIDL